MILVNSGAFLSISSWFCELTELIFVMIPYISSTGYPPTTQRIMGHVNGLNQEHVDGTVKGTVDLQECLRKIVGTRIAGDKTLAKYISL